MSVTTIQTGNCEQDRQTARDAAGVLSEGGLVVFPTETVYGIAASAVRSDAIAALRRFKDRDTTQPFTVHLPGPEAAGRYIEANGSPVHRLIQKVFPGPVTLVVDVPDDVIDRKMREMEAGGVPAIVREQLYHRNTVGLRCPDHPMAREILGALSDPVVATSANRRGQGPPRDAREAAAAVGDAADLVIDGGTCRYAKASTIVRVLADGQVSVVREGVYERRIIEKLLRWTMLVVCSGNTCRSPMAEVIARKILAEHRGIDPSELEAAGIRVVSAGAFAMPGSQASPEAIKALRSMGLDLGSHRSRALTPELVHEADVIYCMTSAHVQAVVQSVPMAAPKTMLLDPKGDVDDPFGSDTTAYQRCAELLRRRLVRRLKEQQVLNPVTSK